MPDTERTPIMLANRVLRTLSNVALAADQREDREVAASRAGVSRMGSPAVWHAGHLSAGAVGVSTTSAP